MSIGELSTKKGEDEWVETHAGQSSTSTADDLRVIDEIPDADDHDELSHGMGGLSMSSAHAAGEEIPDIDEIPDMEEEDLEGEDDAAVAAPKKAATSAAANARFVLLCSR